MKWLNHTEAIITYIWVTVEHVEPIQDFSPACPSSNVQEVGRVATVQLDDVHSSHGQASTIHWREDKMSSPNTSLATNGVIILL